VARDASIAWRATVAATSRLRGVAASTARIRLRSRSAGSPFSGRRSSTTASSAGK